MNPSGSRSGLNGGFLFRRTSRLDSLFGGMLDSLYIISIYSFKYFDRKGKGEGEYLTPPPPTQPGTMHLTGPVRGEL